MNGILNFLKPPGMTSHDAVAVVRRVYGPRKWDTPALWILRLPVFFLSVWDKPRGLWKCFRKTARFTVLN